MPRRRGPSLQRADVIAAALALVREDGADALGVHAVARRLGIRAPSLYNHVDGERDLRAAVAVEGWRALDAAWREAASGLRGAEALAALARAYRDFARREPALYRLMARVRLPADEEAGEMAARLLQRLREPLRDLGVSGDRFVHAARALRSALHGFVLLEQEGQFGLPDDVEESFHWLVGALIGAIAAEGAVARDQRSST